MSPFLMSNIIDIYYIYKCSIYLAILNTQCTLICQVKQEKSSKPKDKKLIKFKSTPLMNIVSYIVYEILML